MDEKPNLISEVRRGIVTRFGSRGFGFITDIKTRRDLFFHATDILDHTQPPVGTEVEYRELAATRGPRAIQIQPLRKPSERRLWPRAVRP